MDPLDLTYLKAKGTADLTREKGRNLGAKREKGKGEESILRSILTLHTAAHARTNERNDFPVGLSPPASDNGCDV